MNAPHKNLIEVNCSFSYPEENVKWDNTFFGRYYDKIQEFGYTNREDRKGFQITFNPEASQTVTQQEVEAQILFKNPNGMAVLLGERKISFHCTLDYGGWDKFIAEVVNPLYAKYKDLGLGNGFQQCSIVYLNRYEVTTNDPLSDYSPLVQPIIGFDKEVVTNMQRGAAFVHEDIQNGIVVAKLSSISNDNYTARIISLECGAITNAINISWENQANLTHSPIRDFYDAVTTEKLRNL